MKQGAYPFHEAVRSQALPSDARIEARLVAGKRLQNTAEVIMRMLDHEKEPGKLLKDAVEELISLAKEALQLKPFLPEHSRVLNPEGRQAVEALLGLLDNFVDNPDKPSDEAAKLTRQLTSQYQGLIAGNLPVGYEAVGAEPAKHEDLLKLAYDDLRALLRQLGSQLHQGLLDLQKGVELMIAVCQEGQPLYGRVKPAGQLTDNMACMIPAVCAWASSRLTAAVDTHLPECKAVMVTVHQDCLQ